MKSPRPALNGVHSPAPAIECSSPFRRVPESVSGAGVGRRSWLVPLLLIGLLASHVVICVAIVMVARSGQAFAIEPDYYAKAKNWNAIAAQERQNTELGWAATIQVGAVASATGERTLQVGMSDANRLPIQEATVQVTAFHHAHGDQRTEISLPSAAAGVYVGALAIPWNGLWEFRLSVQRGDQTFTRTLQMEVGSPEEPRWRP